jgi:hypothetical protein
MSVTKRISHCSLACTHSLRLIFVERLRDSGTVLRGGGHGRRQMRDARGHHRRLTPKLQDRKDGADGKNSVDKGFESAALFFLRAQEKRISGFKCFRISRGCFHGYLSVRCRNPAVRIQDFR